VLDLLDLFPIIGSEKALAAEESTFPDDDDKLVTEEFGDLSRRA
jgi:hypothetical protein